MKKIMHQEIYEFVYDTKEERENHIKEMALDGWENGGKVRRLKRGVSIWESNNENNYEWFASFTRYN